MTSRRPNLCGSVELGSRDYAGVAAIGSLGQADGHAVAGSTSSNTRLRRLALRAVDPKHRTQALVARAEVEDAPRRGGDVAEENRLVLGSAREPQRAPGRARSPSPRRGHAELMAKRRGRGSPPAPKRHPTADAVPQGPSSAMARCSSAWPRASSARSTRIASNSSTTRSLVGRASRERSTVSAGSGAMFSGSSPSGT